MSRKSYEGRKAYEKAIKQGLSKEEAKQASNNVKAEIDKEYQGLKPKSNFNTNSFDDIAYYFDSDLNGNGTYWHTAEDL